MENAEPVKQSRAISLLKRVPGGEQIVAASKNGTASAVTPSPPPQAPAIIESSSVSEFDLDPPKAVVTQPVVEKKLLARDALPEDFISDDPSDEIDGLIDPSENIGLHLKKFRTKLKAVNKEKREQAQELETLRKKVTDYESGIAVPELTIQQTARIEELEKFETLYNFKGSPAYQNKFVVPIQEEREKLNELAAEYEIDDASLDAVLAAPNAREASRLLTELFPDEVGAIEAKSILRNIEKIHKAAQDAEAEPAKSFTRMQEENVRIIQDQRARANDAIAHVSKEAWSESLLHLRSDPRFPEITFKEGDTEHNERYVRPILVKAGQEYGKIVRHLAENGLTSLPKDLSIALARMSQLSHQAAVVAIERDRLAKRVAELEAVVDRRNYVNRPGVNSTGSNGVVSGNSGKAVGSQNAGRNVLNRVMGKAI